MKITDLTVTLFSWDDLPALKTGAQWNIATAREYLSFRKADPWADYWTKRQTLAAAMKTLGFQPRRAAAAKRQPM